ncbi:MAG: PD40 domain-containing protein, partial [Bacteroidetes bacterium]|nr:PD40 domain-containing protein [Bacteroidota bacterium]
MKINAARLKFFLLPLLVLCAASMLSAQSARAYERAGDKAFAAKDYNAAFAHFRDAMAVAPEEVGIWFKYAEVTRQFNAYEEAEKYYTKVGESKEAGAFPLALFWLGQVKKSLGKYQEALGVFEDFLGKSTQPDYYTQWANNELNACRWALADPEAPTDKVVQVKHLDKKINTPFSEFGAVEADNTMYYSSFRFDFPEDNHLPERKLTKILTSENLAKGRVMPRDFNEAEKHTAHTAFSTDGQRIYFTVCEYVTSSDIRCEIVYREKDKRGRWEKQLVKLPEIINRKGFTATQPTVGFDSVTQKEVLFFASDRPGGRGKLDIWYCELEKDKFLEPKNMEAVNTPENEISPFFHTASQTLFFSSDGRSGLGGYDVFSLGRKPDWGEVRNVGKPVNSSYHDIYYSLNAAGMQGFLSSNRPGSFYLDPDNKACCYDIFQVTYEDAPKTTVGIPPPVVEIPVEPTPPTFEKLEDFLPLALYFDNDEPDKRTDRTTTKKAYETTYFKYIERKTDFIEQYTKPIEDEDAADEASLNLEDFFQEEVKKGYDHLQLFSGILLKRLESGDRVEIVIKGYTSARAKTDYNDHLAQRRISSLRNQFDSYKGGVFESYLKHGKLVITEAPLGETTAASDISDDLAD